MGPFNFEELSKEHIKPETLVWCDGMNDWRVAAEIDELRHLFSKDPVVVPPPIKNHIIVENKEKSIPPETWLAQAILVTIFCCLPFGIVGIVNAAKVEKLFYSGDIEGAKMASREAKRWTMVSFWIGIIFILLYYFVYIYLQSVIYGVGE